MGISLEWPAHLPIVGGRGVTPILFGLSSLECMNQYRVFHPRE